MRPLGVVERAVLRAPLCFALRFDEHASGHVEPGRLAENLRETIVVEEDDGVARVEAEQVDVRDELVQSVAFQAMSFDVGTYSSFVACATASYVT